MSDPIRTLDAVLRPVLAELAPDHPDADPTVRPSDHADAQVNGALPLAKRIGTPPRELAQRIVDSGVFDGIGAAEVAGPGFVNVTFDEAWLAGQLATVAGDDDLGVTAADEAKTVVIDYSAPNVAKEMHVGHLRTTVIGDSLVRLMDAAGHRVIRENHIGDWGTPFGMLIEHLVDLGEDRTADGLGQGELDRFYKAARAKFDADEAFKDRARDRVVALQGGDDETRRLWGVLVEQSTRHFNEVYSKLGILLTDDDLAGESMYQPMMGSTIARLDESGLLEVDDGAKVVFPPGFENRDGAPLPLIVQARTGGFNYATSDLACVLDRVERLHADVMLYVIGTPQSQHLQMVWAVARMAGWLPDDVEVVHVNFGNVLGDDRKMLKSRSGDPLKFVDLLDEAVRRADAAIAEKNPSLTPDVRAVAARQVGIGAVKYADLSTDRIKDYVFDWDRMLAFEGNTGPYLQYAHARICSIFRRAAVDRADVRGAPITLGAPAEHALALQVLAFPTAISATLETYSPHKLCTYVFELAQAFSTFYDACPILKSDEPVRTSRLALADVTARVLERGLGLLGIDAPQEM